jgi:polar amino acid transport system substrate-binding protein
LAAGPSIGKTISMNFPAFLFPRSTQSGRIEAARTAPAWSVLGAILGAFFCLGLQLGVARAGVIDEIRDTGILVAGTRADSPPFGYYDPQGHLVGFSVDILKDITTALSTSLKKPIRLELKTTTPETRTGMIHTGVIKIECGITTPTWARQQKVDFSIPFFANGTRILTRRRFGETVEDLAGKRIGVVADGTTRGAVETAVRKAVIVEVPDMSQGMQLFRSGKIDAMSNISVVLRGLLKPSDDKGDLILVPRDGALQYEPIACMLPRDDSEWRTFVDHVIARDLEGAADYDGRYVAIYNTWFGPGSALPMPLDRKVIELLTNAAYWIN